MRRLALMVFCGVLSRCFLLCRESEAGSIETSRMMFGSILRPAPWYKNYAPCFSLLTKKYEYIQGISKMEHIFLDFTMDV